ncbi:gliding motility-associated C-terminal domain-containing protein [Salegentibacter sp. F188]|uniref:Gliding motility-associated C-terminal domain-containing protein n=1 Tax=Autumnicola patrickiae TaxID=3075591 RepID=A0ABU3DY75_9FLAO|nr:gliding motility-associated C-terminal domain-containing protein [Salegentibacter sp. F188]MDT0688674.1 gliding motility-associated C-terminal domain-containing protein [Salegentibacter sp. F188]
MQNFTLGKKGKVFSIFTFLLLMGIFPSFGQTGNCPAVSDEEQSFCYLSTVSDLEATAASGTTLRWYRTATSTNPIPGNELLREETYFAGNADGTCNGSRPSVTVSIDDIGAPEPSFGVVFSPCMYSMEGANTVQELIDLVNPTNDGTNIEVYTEEFSGAPLNENENLSPGESYFVGQRSQDGCPSSRVAVRYDPIAVGPPTGVREQIFCEGATVADLQASGINRWYSTEDSNPPLDEDTPLIDGELYYATQIINRVNSPEPPCESMLRFEVEVTIQSAGDDSTDNVLCISEADTQLNTVENARTYFESLLEDEVPPGGSFSPSLQSIVDSYDGSADYFETTYTATFEGGCEDEVVLGVNVEDPNAGDDIDLVFCTAEIFEIVQLALQDQDAAIAILAERIGDDVDLDGEFSNPTLQEIAFQFLQSPPSFPVTIETTYTVGAGTECQDSAEISLTIEEAGPAMAGEFTVPDTCIDGEIINLTELIDPLTTTPGGTFTGEGVTTNEDGDFVFNPSLAGADTFTITYSISAEDSPCITEGASSEFTITVDEEASQAEVGPIANQETCVDGDTINLATLLNADNTTLGGTFSGTGISNGIFDPSTAGAGEFTITYDVNGDDLECVIGDATGTFTINVDEEASQAEVGPIANQETCVDGDTINLATLLNADNTTLGGTFSGTGVSNGIFDPSTAGAGEFTITYDVNGDDLECVIGDATGTFTINVDEEASQAEVGPIANQETCVDGDTINLATLLNADNTTLGGTFSGTGVSNGIFDPSTAGAGEFTITYDVNGDDLECVIGDATGTFTINVDEEASQAEVGPIANQETCVDGDTINLATLLNADNTTLGGTFSGTGVSNGIFDPSTAGAGEFTITYDVNGDDLECVIGDATGTFTINVDEEASQAEVGPIANQETCVDGDTINLATLLNADNTTLGGTFSGTGVSNGIFDPSTAGAGEFTITYDVNGEELECVTGTASTTFEIEVNEGSTTVATIERNFCIAEVPELIENPEDAVSLFNDLLEEQGTEDLTGVFTPNIEVVAAQIAAYLANPETPYQVFETTYTVSNGGCESSTNIEVTIIDEIAAELTEVDNPAPICQNAGIQDLTDFIGENPAFGVFEGYEDGTFNPGTMGPGEYEITYSLDEEDISCVTGSASITFTVTVQDAAYAGLDNTFTVCQNAGIQNLFSRLDADTVDMDGEWTYNGVLVEDGIINPSEFEPDAYEFIYTVPAENECGNDTSTLLLTVRGVPNAGSNPDELTVCQNEGVQDLFSLLDPEANMNGRFTINGNTILNGMMDPALYEPDTYLVTYIVSTGDGNCSDSAIFTVIVLESANAGADMEIFACTNEGTQNLFEELSADADMDGTFTLGDDTIADGLFDPATYGEGSYEVMYSVDSDNELCGISTSTMTVNVTVAPDAPTVTDLTFCAIEGATVADLGVTGENITYYSNVELTAELEPTDLLVEQPYYVTDVSSEGGCVSEAAIIMVTINDAPAPTIDQTQLELCELDNNTILDLNEAINEPGDIRWYASEDGADALSVNTPLENGVTYYAALYDSTVECESSQRLEYTVQLEDCPLVFPEGISPNDDGRNDRFTVINIAEKYPNYNLEIFNRWGNTIYEGNANTPDWDGTSTESGLGDDVLPVGVYFYIVNFNDGSTPPRQGKIYLSR